MAFVDPTMDAVLAVFGETVSLLREPAVSLSGVFTAPDSLRQFGGISVDTQDTALAVRTADIAGLALQPGERISIRGAAHHIVAVLEDDGAGSNILLRRLAS